MCFPKERWKKKPQARTISLYLSHRPSAPEEKEMLFTFMQIHIDNGKVISTNKNEKATRIHPHGPSSVLEFSVEHKTVQPVTGHHHGTSLLPEQPCRAPCWLLHRISIYISCGPMRTGPCLAWPSFHQRTLIRHCFLFCLVYEMVKTKNTWLLPHIVRNKES